jgi:IclR family acetate operon transcriptional repressor
MNYWSSMKNQESAVNRRRGRPAGSKNKKAEPGQSALSRGLLVLERLAQSDNGITLSDLAQQVGLPPATAHRVLTTLDQQGFIQQDSERGLWFIGLTAFQIGSAFLSHRDFIATARPFMRQLMETAGETANMAVLENGEAVFVSQIECQEMMRMVVRLGSHTPMHASGVGKALLATLPEYEVTKILHRQGLPRLTDHTIDAPAKLRAALDEIRRCGYAVDDEEQTLGLRCVAAPLYDEFSEAIAAVSISGPKVRITDQRVAELGTLVVRTAADITQAIGGQLPSLHPLLQKRA